MTVHGFRLFTINCNGAADKVCGAVTANGVNVPAEPVIGGIHLSQTGENLFGAGVVMFCDKCLDSGNGFLYFRGIRGQITELADFSKLCHQGIAVQFLCFLCL